MLKDLEQRDDLLAEEYRTLMAEKEALVELNAAIETSEDAMAYNARLGGYNEKIIAFQEKRQRFENDVAAYNALVESRPNDQPAEEK